MPLSVSHFFTMFSFYTPWNYRPNVWFSDIYREYKTETYWKKQVTLFNSFQSSVHLLYSCKQQKALALLLFRGGIKLGHWKEMDKIVSYFCSYLQNLRASFFKEQLSVTVSVFLNGLQRNPFYINRPVIAFK